MCTMNCAVTNWGDSAAWQLHAQGQAIPGHETTCRLFQTFDQLRQKTTLTALVVSDTAVAALSALNQVSVFR